MVEKEKVKNEHRIKMQCKGEVEGEDREEDMVGRERLLHKPVSIPLLVCLVCLFCPF